MDCAHHNFENLLFPVLNRRVIRAVTKGEITFGKDEGERNRGSEAEIPSLHGGKSAPCSERWAGTDLGACASALDCFFSLDAQHKCCETELMFQNKQKAPNKPKNYLPSSYFTLLMVSWCLMSIHWFCFLAFHWWVVFILQNWGALFFLTNEMLIDYNLCFLLRRLFALLFPWLLSQLFYHSSGFRRSLLVPLMALQIPRATFLSCPTFKMKPKSSSRFPSSVGNPTLDIDTHSLLSCTHIEISLSGLKK